MPSLDRRLIAKALHLERGDRARALRALGLLIAAAAAVRLLPLSALTGALARIPPRRTAQRALSPGQCADAIRRAASVWPGARCLPQALAGYCLLRRGGWEPTLRIGARLDGERRLDAHAWLECDGVTVTGGGGGGEYGVFTPRTSGHPRA